MNSRERILCALEHRQPDRVPYDLGGCHVTGIHVTAYRNLCLYLGIDPEPVSFADKIQQIVVPGQELCQRLEIDTRGLFPLCSHNCNIISRDAGDYDEYLDEWHFTHRKPKKGGLYWSLVKSPLDAAVIDSVAIEKHSWPIADDRNRIAGLRKQALKYKDAGKIVMLKGLCAGIFEMAQRVRGMENVLCDLIISPNESALLLDKLLELKIRFWSMALDELGDVIDIVVEGDDYGTQESQLISYETFKCMVRPRLKALMDAIRKGMSQKKKNSEKGYIFFHSCGNIRPFINDFIDMGIDILNPVHISATGMEPAALKKDYGRHVTFWGGGVETQHVLSRGTPGEVRDDVKRNIECLMPGGGYVFNTVHNIQAEVSPQNIVAMWDAMRDFGRYS